MYSANSFRDFPSCLNFFRDLCRHCFSHRDYDTFSSPIDAVQVLLKCFLSLEDNVFLSLICRKLCCHPDNLAIKEIVNSSEFLQLASNSDCGRTWFCLLLDHRISTLKVAMSPEATLTWSQPKALILTGYSDIEIFLRSPTEMSMSYGNFSNLGEAKDDWVKLVKCSASLFFEAECQESISSSWHILISKVVRFVHFPPPNQNEELKDLY